MKNQIIATADQALLAPRGDVRKDINNILLGYRVDLDPEKVNINMPDTREYIEISFAYDRYLDFIVTKHRFPFYIDVQRKGGKGGGIVQSVQDSIESSNAASAQKYQEAVKNAVGK